MSRRFVQTSQGQLFIGVFSGQASKIPDKSTTNLQTQVSDLPSKFVVHKIPNAQPSNSLLPEFIPQLQPHLVLAGKDALFKVQLTQLQGGAVLGLALARGLAGRSSCQEGH